MSVSVAFQGEAGAFSEVAARALLGMDIQPQGMPTFEETVAAVTQGAATYGILPIENSIYGQIGATASLLQAHPQLCTLKRIVHPIEQALLGLPGATIDGLRTVGSHPVALRQCTDFFKERPAIRAQELHDTAGAIRLMVERGDLAVGAIGPAEAAPVYGAIVLASAIQDRPENYTTFALIGLRRESRGNSSRPAP